MEPQYKPSTEWQAVNRSHRQGQTRAVTVYRLIARDSRAYARAACGQLTVSRGPLLLSTETPKSGAEKNQEISEPGGFRDDR